MAAPTYAQLLEMYMNTAAALALNQSYTTPGGMSFTRSDLTKVQKMIDWLEDKISSAAATTTNLTTATSVTQAVTLLTGQVQATF